MLIDFYNDNKLIESADLDNSSRIYISSNHLNSDNGKASGMPVHFDFFSKEPYLNQFKYISDDYKLEDSYLQEKLMLNIIPLSKIINHRDIPNNSKLSMDFVNNPYYVLFEFNNRIYKISFYELRFLNIQNLNIIMKDFMPDKIDIYSSFHSNIRKTCLFLSDLSNFKKIFFNTSVSFQIFVEDEEIKNNILSKLLIDESNETDFYYLFKRILKKVYYASDDYKLLSIELYKEETINHFKPIIKPVFLS